MKSESRSTVCTLEHPGPSSCDYTVREWHFDGLLKTYVFWSLAGLLAYVLVVRFFPPKLYGKHALLVVTGGLVFNLATLAISSSRTIQVGGLDPGFRSSYPVQLTSRGYPVVYLDTVSNKYNNDPLDIKNFAVNQIIWTQTSYILFSLVGSRFKIARRK